jgi:hypothetical protein
MPQTTIPGLRCEKQAGNLSCWIAVAAAIINYYDSDAPSQTSLMQDPEFGLGAGNQKILEKYGNFTKRYCSRTKNQRQ